MRKRAKFKIKFVKKVNKRMQVGDIGIMLLSMGYLKRKEIENTGLIFKKVMQRKLRFTKKLRFFGESKQQKNVRKRINLGFDTWLRLNFKVDTRKKSKGARMGKGIGKVKGWLYKFNAGSFLFEASYDGAKPVNHALFKKTRKQLSVKTRVFINRDIRELGLSKPEI